ncbi:MAG TPA: alanine/glycine:cation symporter family protein [Pirellulaceae bacterium]|jgi:AGCS family alanine or glycine:cation symporter|nr:alanine/glycine:cation symporter family protein [Pirellulaceae bacterium]
MNWFGSRQNGLLLIVLSLALPLGIAGVTAVTGPARSGLFAQDSEIQPKAVEQHLAEEQEPDEDAPNAAQLEEFVYRLPDHPPVEEPPAPEPAFWDRIDGIFKSAVNLVGSAFFYPVGQYERTYLVVDEAEYFGREKGTSEPFARLVTVGRPDPTEALSPADAETEAVFRALYIDEATGETVEADATARPGEGASPRFYVRPRGSDQPFLALDYFVKLDPTETKTLDELVMMDLRGELKVRPDAEEGRRFLLEGRILDPSGEERDLEIAVAKPRLKKFVLEEGAFRRDIGYRQLLGADPTREIEEGPLARATVDVLTVSEALAYARDGKLQHDVPEQGEQSLHLKTEYVGGIPLVVLWLFTGATIFTLYLRFFNIWGFWHAIKCVVGKYDDPSEPGEVTHAQALFSALSATVGLGNIAGVAIAMAAGGPGAFFWMLMCGFLGMTSKCVECALGQYYREVKPDGTVLGGPMQYLYYGLKERGMGPLGWILSLMFSVMCILASFGGGNMFQGNQAGAQVLGMLQQGRVQEIKRIETEMSQVAAVPEDEAGLGARVARIEELSKQRDEVRATMETYAARFKPIFGLILAGLVGVVIIGGIKRIALAAEKIVPAMCLIYIVACLWIIAMHITQIPAMIAFVFSEAFSPRAFGGGLFGVLVIGVQRAAFSNEAGVGSAAIAHSAAKTDEPIREGAVALLEPFIDTIVVCSMTALVMLLTGYWKNTEITGSELTSAAFGSQIWFFPYILTVAICLFAFSTQISWSYYGERCWALLFGPRWSLLYKGLFVTASFCGVVFSLQSVMDFSDLMILAMAFPNVLGLYILAPKVRRGLLDYWRRMHEPGAQDHPGKPPVAKELR